MAARTNTNPTPRQVAVAEVNELVEKGAQLTLDLGTAETELVALRDRAGAEVLADQSAAAKISGKMRDLRDRIDILTRAVAAAAEQEHAARVRVLLIDAEAYDTEAEKYRTLLAEHDAVTVGLLAQLEEHEGRYVPAAMLRGGSSQDVVRTSDTMNGTMKSSGIRNAMKLAELRARICRAVAEGRNPANEIAPHRNLANGKIFGFSQAEAYPPGVAGPDAILPAAGARAAESQAQAAEAQQIEA